MAYKISEDKMAKVVELSGLDEQTVQEQIGYDWPNGEEHQEWLNEASAQEIADVASDLAKDSVE